MSLLSSLDAVLQESIRAREERSAAKTAFSLRERLRQERTDICAGNENGKKQNEDFCHAGMNVLAGGDNLKFMDYLADAHDMKGKIDFIYIDPPFFSKSSYNATTRIRKKETGETLRYTGLAYDDTWENGAEDYLKMMTERLIMMRELLKDSGCIFIHLDWHIVHYVKVIADSIFGPENFVNEIIWNYKSGGAGKRHFGRKHDTILFYAKTKAYPFYPQKEKSYNRGLKPYYFKGVQEFQDEIGWHTMVNMKDVWPLDMVGRTSGERVEYATQKPEALLERMIQSCTRPGSICADFFAGSGTLAAVAEKMGRRWICCDDSRLAIAQIQKRLSKKESAFDYYEPSCDEPLWWEKESPPYRQGELGGVKAVSIRTDFIPWQGDGKKKISIVLESEKEHMIDHWSIDYSFDGVHSPQMHFFRKGETIQTKAEGTVGSSGSISVKLTDITGDVRYKVITLRAI